jgi:hypothetical protein
MERNYYLRIRAFMDSWIHGFMDSNPLNINNAFKTLKYL